MKVSVVVQARMSSSRLPGKVAMPLAGAPAIVRMMERVQRVKADHHVVATSDDPSDDELAELCATHGLECFRGPLDDVLGRVLDAAPAEHHVVRLTGDCPLIDPALVDRHIETFRHERPWAQYVTNASVRTFPDGLDVEVVDRLILEEAARTATTTYDREHVTPWVRRRARSVPIAQDVDLSAIRITLDERADYDVIAAIYDALYPHDPTFGTEDIYRLMLSRPDLIRLASGDVDDHVRRIEEHLT